MHSNQFSHYSATIPCKKYVLKKKITITLPKDNHHFKKDGHLF